MSDDPANNDYGIRILFGLDDLTVLITGCGGRLGGEIASACLALGASVVATDVSRKLVEEKAAQKKWPVERIELMAMDVRDQDQVSQVFKNGSKRFGDLNGLVNNAGAAVHSPFMERNEVEFDHVIDVNLKGTFWCTKAFVDMRRKHGKGGCIVNIGSIYGLISPDPGIYYEDWPRNASEVYSATKAGIIQMTRYFAAHLAADGIRVNAVSPGGVRNPWSPQPERFQRNYGERCPMGRMAEIGEIPGAVVFMMPPAASYITGQNLAIDGGMSAW